MAEAKNVGWEPIHTVNNFFDRPRLGVADFNGAPHVYRCERDEAGDDWSQVFALAPIDPETFAFVLEDWAIWLRWRSAFTAGALKPGDDHPALAADRQRHEELAPLKERIFEVSDARTFRAVPEFDLRSEPGRVKWHSAAP